MPIKTEILLPCSDFVMHSPFILDAIILLHYQALTFAQSTHLSSNAFVKYGRCTETEFGPRYRYFRKRYIALRSANAWIKSNTGRNGGPSDETMNILASEGINLEMEY